jgi:hypothetical protein
MSRSPVDTALRAAARLGTPHVHRDGPLVVLVLHGGTVDHVTGEIRAATMQRMCWSAALARSVAARVLQDARTFAGHPDPLAVSVLYAEAALRFARLRRRAA